MHPESRLWTKILRLLQALKKRKRCIFEAGESGDQLLRSTESTMLAPAPGYWHLLAGFASPKSWVAPAFLVEAATSWHGTANWITWFYNGKGWTKTNIPTIHVGPPKQNAWDSKRQTKNARKHKVKKKQHHHHKCSITSSPPLTNTDLQRHHGHVFLAECLPYQQSYGFSLCHHSLERWSRHMGKKQLMMMRVFALNGKHTPIHSNTTLIHRKIEWNGHDAA